MRSIFKTSVIYFSLIILMSMSGCNKFKGDQEVPAYIKIDSIAISQSSATAMGITPTAQIPDVWISVDGWKIGGYQLPACIPILKKGKWEILLEAGIYVDNMYGRRGIYPFYSGKKLTLHFAEDSITSVGFVEVDIRESNNYVFSEDFERGRHGFDTATGFHSAPLEIKATPESMSDRLYGEHIGLIHLTQSDSICCILSKESFVKETALPFNKPIFVEIDYQTNNKFDVGIVYYANQKPYFYPILTVGVQRKPEWSKVYVEINNTVTRQLYQDKDTEFKLLIRADLDKDNTEANIYLDNIRVVF